MRIAAPLSAVAVGLIHTVHGPAGPAGEPVHVVGDAVLLEQLVQQLSTTESLEGAVLEQLLGTPRSAEVARA